MAYNCESKAWFWVEAAAAVSAANATTRKYIQAAFPDGTLKRAGRWVSIEAQEPGHVVLVVGVAQPRQGVALRQVHAPCV